MTTTPIIRPKITKELRLRIYKEIIDFPEIGGTEIMDNLIQEDPRNAAFFFSSKVDKTFTLEELMMIYRCKTIAEAKKMYRKLGRNRSDEFSMNNAVITRAKTWLNKNHAPKTPNGAVYGASGLGYVTENALNMNRAARWMYPRLRQMQHECMAWNKTAERLDRSDSPERKKVSEAVRKWVSKAMVYREIKDNTDGIRDQFLH